MAKRAHSLVRAAITTGRTKCRTAAPAQRMRGGRDKDIDRQTQLRVNLDILSAGRPLPVYPDEQTFRLFVGMSQTCQ